MYFSIKETKTKRFDGTVEKVLVGDPMPEATRFRKPHMWARFVEPDSAEYKANVSMWEKRTGRKVDDLFKTDKVEAATAPVALDFSGNAEFKGTTKESIIEELKLIKEADQPDLAFSLNGTKEVLFEILLKARKVTV